MVVRDEDESWLNKSNKVSGLDEAKKKLDESYSALGKSIKSLMECVGNDPGKFFDSVIDSTQKRSVVASEFRINQESDQDRDRLMKTMTRGEVINLLECLKNWMEHNDRFSFSLEYYVALDLAISYLFLK